MASWDYRSEPRGLGYRVEGFRVSGLGSIGRSRRLGFLGFEGSLGLTIVFRSLGFGGFRVWGFWGLGFRSLSLEVSWFGGLGFRSLGFGGFGV